MDVLGPSVMGPSFGSSEVEALSNAQADDCTSASLMSMISMA